MKYDATTTLKIAGYPPTPGSQAAVEQGCTCPVIDNSRGKGRPDGTFWTAEGCPVHTPPS